MANELQFFLDAPVAYGDGIVAATYGAAGTLWGSTATNGTVVYKRCSGPCAMTLRCIYAQVGTTVNSATPVVFTAAVRPQVGTGTVASGTRVVGTISVPITAAAGDLVYGTLSDPDININPNEELIIELTTKAVTSGGGYVGSAFTYSLVGPTSGGSATSPKVTAKPYGQQAAQGPAVGQVKLVTTGA